MKTVTKVVDGVIKTLMATSAFVLFMVNFLQVVFRFILKSPLAWSQDVIRLCFTYLVFLGAAWCVREKAHLNIDVVISCLKPKLRAALELVINIALCGFFIFLAYYGWKFAVTGKTQLAPYLPVPMFYYYLSVPISAVLMLYYMVPHIIGQVKNFGGAQKEGN